MKLYTDIVTDYLAGRSLAAHAQEWFFTQPGYCFQEPDGSDAQKAAVMQVYEQVLRTVETFVPGNRPVWDALFPDWQDILRGAETALIVGYPPPNDAVVLKSPAGVDTAVLDMGLWVQYLGAVPVERVAHNLLTHELCHVCIHRHRPELDAAQETGDYLSRLDAFTFDEGFAHFVSYNDREANQVDWDAPELRAVGRGVPPRCVLPDRRRSLHSSRSSCTAPSLAAITISMPACAACIIWLAAGRGAALPVWRRNLPPVGRALQKKHCPENQNLRLGRRF